MKPVKELTLYPALRRIFRCRYADVLTYPDYTFLAYFGSGNAPNTALAETFEGFIDQWIINWKTLISKASKINNI